MPASYEQINYNLRPAKQIERRMLCEAFHRLSEFGTVRSYRYIGFGSIYFRDFVLLHKEFGISNMISIERDLEKQERFRFNRPFGCIELRFGDSNEILPTLPWDVRTIVWLDYDYQLDKGVLTDISWFCANALSGSVLVVTVDARPASIKNVLEEFSQHIGEERVPSGTGSKDLMHWGTALVARRVINNHILDELNSRSGGRASGSRFRYKQLFHFHYQDTAKMLTVGGVLYDEGQAGKVDACRFGDLAFIKSEDDPHKIEVPKLTYRELQHLDAQLPTREYRTLDGKGIPQTDLERYAKVYRYFPNFAEIET